MRRTARRTFLKSAGAGRVLEPAELPAPSRGDRPVQPNADFVARAHGERASYGNEVASYLAARRGTDPEGIFLIDGSYLFVPDNPNYENSKVGWFDEHNHPISREQAEARLPQNQCKRCRLRRYYQMVALSHTSRSSDYLMYCGAKMLREGGRRLPAPLPPLSVSQKRLKTLDS